jgi:hypothetical protein
MATFQATAAVGSAAFSAVLATAATLLYIAGLNYADDMRGARGYATPPGAAPSYSDFSGSFYGWDSEPLMGGMNEFARPEDPFTRKRNNPLGSRTVAFGSAPLAPGAGIVGWGRQDGLFEEITIYGLPTSDSPGGGPEMLDDAATLVEGVTVQPSASALAMVGVVPEPSTWTLMIVGFGAAGMMIRSARRRHVLVA